MSWDILPKGNLQYFLQKLKAKFDLKVDKEAGKGLSANDYTTTEKNKLAGIEAGAQVNPTIDSALSDSSVNAVQNKVVKAALDGKADSEEIPTVNNNTITIQLNGVTVESFKLNQATDETINIQVTKSDVGLGNVGNFYAVSTAENQGLSNLQKKNARDNINATNDEAPDETYNISNHQIQISTSPTPTTINSFITKLRTLVINVMDDIRTWLNAEIDFNYPALGTDHKFNMGVITQSSISDFSDAVEDALDEVARGFNDHADWVATKADKTEISGSKSVNGNPIAISDAANAYAEEVIANIEPIQDLHGYDHPWVGGAGKNLLPLIENAITDHGITITPNKDNAGNVVSLTLNGTATTDVYIFIANNITIPNERFTLSWQTINSYLYMGLDGLSNVGGGSSVGYRVYDGDGVKRGVFVRVYGNRSYNNIIIYPMLELGSSVTSFAPYSNICPISGLDSVEVKRTGKNLIPMTVDGIKSVNTRATWNGNSYTFNNVTFTILTDDGNNVIGIKVSGTASNPIYFTLHSAITWNGTYKISPLPPGASYTHFYGRLYYTDNTDVGFLSGEVTFTASNKSGYVQLVVPTNQTVDYTVQPMIRLDSETDSTFEPYQSETHTASLPQTTYGGTLNVQTGELVVDRAFVEYDGSSDENWTMPGTTTARAFLMAVTLANSVNYTVASKTPPIIANYMKAISQTDAWGSNNAFVAIDTATTNKLFTGINTITSVEAWKTYLASNPLQVCYELLTPITYHLTPEQVKLFKDYNYITTNADTLDITYQSDNVLGEILGEAEKYTDRVIDDLGTASKKDIETTLANDGKLPTGSAVISYLNSNKYIKLLSKTVRITFNENGYWQTDLPLASTVILFAKGVGFFVFPFDGNSGLYWYLAAKSPASMEAAVKNQTRDVTIFYINIS